MEITAVNTGKVNVSSVATTGFNLLSPRLNSNSPKTSQKTV